MTGPAQQPRRGIRSQRGVALVILAMVMAALSYLLLQGLNARSQGLQREQKSLQSLARAKEALIAYAVTYAMDRPDQLLTTGLLPCPEDPGTFLPEGSEAGSCGATNVSALGRLPWRSLGIPPPNDGAAECLWYAVSGRHKKANGSAVFDNESRVVAGAGQFEVLSPDGVSLLASDVVAVVFAPEAASGSQTHANSASKVVCPGNFTAGNYLDRDNTASPISDPYTGLPVNNAFVSGAAGSPTRFIAGPVPGRDINDRLLYVTRAEIQAAVIERVYREITRRIGRCVAFFATRNAGYPGDKRLPLGVRPKVQDIGPYTDDCSYNDDNDRRAGRLANVVGTSGNLTSNATFAETFCGPGSGNQLLRQGSPCPDWNTPYYTLWNRWKSLFFYAVAPSFRPQAPTPPSCGDCDQINGSGNYAAVVLFGGPPLAGQPRSTDSDREKPENYLEGRNENNVKDKDQDPGRRNYETRATSSSSFNDILYCVSPALEVIPCPLP
jgi:hypothetical protein